MNRTFFLVVFLVLPLFLTGCSDHVSISGRVTYSDDGSPLELGRVVFEPEKGIFHARGEIGADGKYSLSTNKPGDGLPPGKYRVYVDDTSRWVTNPDGRSGIEIPLIETKHNYADTSGLVVDVDRKTKKFDFQVDRAPGSKELLSKHGF